MRKLSKLVILVGVAFLIFGWSGASFAKYEVFFVPSFQDSFTTTKPEIRIEFPKGGVLPPAVSIDTLKSPYTVIDSSAAWVKIYSEGVVHSGFLDSTYQTDEHDVLCLFWDGYADSLDTRDSASGKPAYIVKVDSGSTSYKFPLTPCKNNISRAAGFVVKPAHKSGNGYTNRTPIFQAEFSIFKTAGRDTTWYDGMFFDTNLTVILKDQTPGGTTDTLYDYKRFPQLPPGLISNLRKIHPGKMVFTVSWLDTSYYLPLDTSKAYNYTVKGGVWNYQSLIIIHGSPPSYSFTAVADTFLVDGIPPEMELQELNYVSKSPYFVLSASDVKAGINTDSLFVDLYAVDLYGEIPKDSVEDRNYLKNLHISNLDTLFGSALVHTGVELEEVEGGKALDVWVFNGRPFDVNEYMTNLDAVYPDSLGPMDKAGNLITPLYKRFYVDGMPPNVRLSSGSTHQTMIFEISDTSSCFQVNTSGHIKVLCAGVNTASIKLYEGLDQLVSPDLTEYNSSTGVYSVYYSPTLENVWLNLDVADKVGNIATYQNYYEDDQLSLVEPHNYPNPFSPVSPIVDHRRTIIDPGLTRTADVEVSIDIYDLAGHYVASVTPNMADGGRGYWDGRTKDGTLVANGVYLCYIQVRDTAQNKTLTEVIKIAVAKNDKRIF